jgi:heterodisulfide reductase subunit C
MTTETDPIRIPSKEKRDSFIHEVEELSGEVVLRCYQCGKCTSGCPFVEDMDLKPNQIIRLVQMGLLDVLDADSIWFCAACQLCGSRCPKGVNLAKIMEALRTILLRKSIDRLLPNEVEKGDLDEIPNIALVCAFRKQTG